MYSLANSFMTLEASQCQVTKRPNRCFVDARYLWVEGLMTFEESHFQVVKMLNRGSFNARYLWIDGLMPLEESSSFNGITKKAFTNSMYF
jgi:hypothetical protein